MEKQTIPRGADGYVTAGHSSALYRILAVLGWLCMAATVVMVGLHANWLFGSSIWPMLRDDTVGLVAVILDVLARTSLGIAIGLGLLVSARVCLPNVKVGRFKLWAKLLFLAAVELSLAFPIYCYSTVLFIQIFGHDPMADPIDPLGREVLGAAALFSSTPFVIGFTALAVALIWGRRKPPPDIPAVFS